MFKQENPKDARPALIQHVSEMGSLDRSETVVEFSANWQFGSEDPFTFDDEISKDVMQQKIFECQWWCVRLARAEFTDFAESDIYDVVSANLRDLFVHCCDTDKSVRIAAHHVVSNYALRGLRFVQQRIAEATLGRMEDLLPESTEVSEEDRFQGLFSSLKLLWRADDDPERSYAEAIHQLKALLWQRQSSRRLRVEICSLLAC
ncbi:unnamed protein product [Symbiodinium necroappetens]|uniref:Uncharacterized protein n=1 Tax=Symbiodinium necroappetens TaxID=1628268 RepID=A0A813B8Z8_9DINO|nr:unnamed protein product [Symbiodinium necroappetens]